MSLPLQKHTPYPSWPNIVPFNCFTWREMVAIEIVAVPKICLQFPLSHPIWKLRPVSWTWFGIQKNICQTKRHLHPQKKNCELLKAHYFKKHHEKRHTSMSLECHTTPFANGKIRQDHPACPQRIFHSETFEPAKILNLRDHWSLIPKLGSTNNILETNIQTK